MPSSDPQPADDQDMDRIWKAMEDRRTAFLVTHGREGPHARPMSTIVRRDDGCVWFLTDSATAKDCEIAADDRCALVFSDGGSMHLAVTGTAELVDDRLVVKGLWSTGAQAFYPEGPEDPSILAIRVTPKIAEYWDGPSKPVALVQMAAALATGSSAADMGRNVKARM